MSATSQAAALAARISEALAASLPGGVVRGVASAGTAVPYASLADIGASDSLTTGRSYHTEARHQLTVFARTLGELEQLAESVRDTVWPGMEPLVFPRGTHTFAIAGPLRYAGEDVAEDGSPLHYGFIDIEVGQDRSR